MTVKSAAALLHSRSLRNALLKKLKSNYNDGLSPFGKPDLTLLGCEVHLNQADGGTAGAGGSDGLGVGGGVYNLGTFAFDLMSVISRNHASDSNDDIFP